MHFHRQRIRQLSAALLLMWLFTLFVGVAQACTTHAAVLQTAAPATAHEHCADQGGHEPAPAAQAACLKLCSQATTPTPSTPTANIDLLGGHPVDALPPVVERVFEPDAPAGPALVPPDVTLDGLRTRPLSIVYLRLTL